MSDNQGRAVLGADMIFKGRIRNARVVEVYGYAEGEISAGHVLVAPGGRFYGTLRSVSADIRGELQGEAFVRSLISIADGGAVHGKVQYGAIQMSPGADLSADLRNVPPTLSGDLQLAVHRGRAVIVTREDLRAVDPDDAPEDLTFRVQRPAYGHVALKSAPGTAVDRFTQADLDAGRVMFQHDGTGGDTASFDVVVFDDDGATSGTAQTVKVTVHEIPQRRPAA